MNYKIIIFVTLFTLPFFTDVYGQQGSRDLIAEYCTTNWARDLVKCADYVPKDYKERETEYQTQELERIKQEAYQSKLAQESQRVCPLGSHLGADSLGNQVCLDSKTNQFVSYPNTSQNDFGDNTTIIGIVVFIIIIAIIVGVVKSQGKSIPSEQLGRQGFPESIKRQVLHNQKNKCNLCDRPIGQVGARLIWFDFDHKDGNSWNNDIGNCQALCKNCHAGKTERDR